jgi:hypothetical protein
MLMNHYVARDEGLVLNDNIAGDQRATSDYRLVADFAVVRDVAGGHDVVVVPDHGL